MYSRWDYTYFPVIIHFFGSNVVDLVNNVDSCPVLAIPQNKLPLNKKEFVFGYDFKEKVVPEKIKNLLKHVEALKIDIKSVSVEEPGSEMTSEQLENISEFREYLQN